VRGECARVRVVHLDDGELFLVGLDVDRLDDVENPPDVGGRVREDDGVGGPVGHHRSVFRDERLQRVGDRLGIDEAKRDQARDEAVAIWRRAPNGLDAALFGLPDRDDLERTARTFDDGEALHLQDRFEDGVGLIDADARR